MDIIREHPEIVSSGHLVLRSDNCSTQYKSRFVFQNLLDIAKNQKIIITWFYGASHGRGLIDAMAWFGCKGPLREAILSRDKWFSTESSMVEYLSNHFESDDSKEYFLPDEEEAAQKRTKGRKEHPVKGCQAAHVLSFHPNGSIFKRNIIDGSEDMMNLKFNDDCRENEQSEEMIEDENEDEVEATLDISAIFEIITENSFVAIKAQPGSLELFHMKITKKGIATENTYDSSQEHVVLKGEPYLIGKWVSFQNECRKYAQYKEAKNVENALINVAEVFSTDVKVNGNLQIDMNITVVLLCILVGV